MPLSTILGILAGGILNWMLIHCALAEYLATALDMEFGSAYAALMCLNILLVSRYILYIRK